MKTVNQYSKHRYPHNPGIHSHKKVSNIRKNDNEFFMKKNYPCHSDTWSSQRSYKNPYLNITNGSAVPNKPPKTKWSNQLPRSTIDIQGYPPNHKLPVHWCMNTSNGLSIAANFHPIMT